MVAASELALSLWNNPAEIPLLAARVAEFGLHHRLPTALIAQFNLALDEAISNIIAHAYDDAGAHEIGVRIALVHGILSVELSDDGRAFDPRATAPPDITVPLDARSIGGLGIHLIRRLMDEFDYRREDGRNHLVFTKRVG